MEGSFNLTLLIITTIVAGILAQVVAKFLKVPSIVFLLIFGVAVGGNGFAWVQPRDLGLGLEVIVSLSVALILFEGGLNLELGDLGKVSASVRNLVSVGTLITLIGGGIAAHYLCEFPWPIAFLYAALVVVTGPTVINPIVREVGIDRRVGIILEGEGVLIDALGAVLAVVMLNIVLGGELEAFGIVEDLILRLSIGGGIGALGGWLLSQFLKRSKFIGDDLKSSVVVAAVLGLYGLAQMIQSESGLMTTVIAGIVVRAESIPDQRSVLKFKGQLTVLTVSVLFILLAANLSIPSVYALGWEGVQTVAVMMLLVRPLNVLVSTWDSTLNWRQKAFLAWCAPRGIVAASVASLFAIVLTERGVNGGDAIKALVFLTIAMTVFLQGLTAGTVAKLLKLSATDASGLVVVGGNPIGLIIAKLFQSKGERVALIDTSAEACKQAADQNIPAFVSNGLDTRALADAGLDTIGTFLALTINTDVNLVLAQRAAEEFRTPRVLAVFIKEDNKFKDIQQAFGGRVPIKSWNKYVRQLETRLGEVRLNEQFGQQLAQFNSLYAAGQLLPIVYERKDKLHIVPVDMTWQTGDRIIYLLYTPKAIAPSKNTPAENPASNVNNMTVMEAKVETVVEASPSDLKPESLNNNMETEQEQREQDYLDMAREILKKIR
jgi:NhaP-type Na+/H+ or K+/H+ antiporter